MHSEMKKIRHNTHGKFEPRCLQFNLLMICLEIHKYGCQFEWSIVCCILFSHFEDSENIYSPPDICYLPVLQNISERDKSSARS